MRATFVWCLVLAVFWMVLSGHGEPLLIWLGFISVLVSALVRERLWAGSVRSFLSPFRPGEFFHYCLWLIQEIIAANIAVIRAVLRSEPALCPTLVRIHSRQDSPAGRAIFANSITLTPGTVVIEMEQSAILVHALLAPMAEPDGFADMDRRVALACAPDD